MKYVSLLTVCCQLISGCSSVGKSVTLGAVVGGSAGAVIGHQQGKGDPKKRATGAALGAGLGGLIGYFANRKKNTQKSKKEAAKTSKEMAPLLSRPRGKRIWVKDQVKGKRYIRGHWEYIIQENSEWVR